MTNGRALIVGRAGYALSCLLAVTVLLVSGYAFNVEHQLGTSPALMSTPGVRRSVT